MTKTTTPAVLSLTEKDIHTKLTSFAIRSIYYDLKKIAPASIEVPSVDLKTIAEDKEQWVLCTQGLLTRIKKALKRAEKKAEPKAEKAPKAEKPERVGGMVKRLLLAGKDTEAILAEVAKSFPEANTNAACVAWYKCDLKKKGL